MYHGKVVPGFPVHPHRGFETITVVRQGFIDHADSIGAAGRYGQGDVQWMTAGRGVQHSEMFPLLHQEADNPVELFQIWLNLPRVSKLAAPYFTMFWREKIPRIAVDNGRAHLTLIAGRFCETNARETTALAAPPDSWASNPKSEIGVYLIELQKGGSLTLPPTRESVGRALYFFSGSSLMINNEPLVASTGVFLDSQKEARLTTATGNAHVLVLQARAIGEPVVQRGPFVMTSQEEIIQTFQDYDRTHFGGWSWGRHDMVHGPKIERFAIYPDGRRETPPTSSD